MKVSCLIGTTANGKKEFIGQPSDYASIDSILDKIADSGGVISKGKIKKQFAKVEMFNVGSRDVTKKRKFNG